ncbi:MAG: AMP-binding protein [Candidatus Acidiferrales bacterium]
MSFLQNIFERLTRAESMPVLQEIHSSGTHAVTGTELLSLIRQARSFLSAVDLQKGDRCALLAPNSIRWAALDLALMAEGVIVVPLYARQAPLELVAMMKDCTAARICCGDENLRNAVRQVWPAAPPISLFDEIFATSARQPSPSNPVTLVNSDPVTIVYTSGTSGEPKGVILTAGNLAHMLSCTNARLDRLMAPHRSGSSPDRVFHYAPFCFAASRILLLTCLSRKSVLSLSMDLSRLADEMKAAAPDYFLNVPMLLERVRAKVEQQIKQRGGLALTLFSKAWAAYLRRHNGEGGLTDKLWLSLADSLMFPTIRRTLGRNLKALICGSAPLAVETQLFFIMLGIPVLQAYGLTETTAICTMDDPAHVTSGRVGPTIPGIEMILGENDEILVRGPNVFPGYWQRPEETAKALRDGWFHTGDQGEVDSSGNWRIIGRLKNLIILSSGHNVAPEPLENMLHHLLPNAQQVMLVGNSLSHLAAILTGDPTNGLDRDRVQAALDQMNTRLPHYKQVRAFYVHREPFTIENGLLTPNGKLRRDVIALRLLAPIQEMYAKKAG